MPFQKARDMIRLQREAKRVKKQLKNTHVEAEAQGVKVVVNAEQEVIVISIDPEVPREQISGLLKDALNRAMKKAQIVAAEQMEGVMGQMGFAMGGDDGMKGMGA